MNRKIGKKLIVLMSFVFVFVIAASACGQKDQQEGWTDDTGVESPSDPAGPDTGAGTETGTAPGAVGFSFSPKGVKIEPGEKAGPLLEKLGEPVDTFEAESCAFVGMDRIFYYPGFHISTYPSGGGEDSILSVTFTDDTVETDQGVYLGMSGSEVAAVYGEGEKSEYSVSYYSGGSELRIFFERDTAVEISFIYIEAMKAYDEAEEE